MLFDLWIRNRPPSTTHGALKHSSSTNPSDQDGSTFAVRRESMVPTDGVDPSDDVRDVDSVSRRAKRGESRDERVRQRSKFCSNGGIISSRLLYD